MIKKILLKAEHKTIVSNVIALFTLQGLNYILPLILLPYLIHVLGIERFGLLAFATATILFFRSVVAYGFDYTGTQQIAIYREDMRKVREVFSSILFVKFILLLLTFLVLVSLMLFVDKIALEWKVFLFTFLVVVGDVLFPTWFFQGMENMKMITYFRMIHKALSIVVIILLVKEEGDYMLVPLIDGIGSILAGMIALVYIRFKFKVSLLIPSVKEVTFQFQNSWHVFLSQIAVHFYTTINIFVLGLLTDNETVGYYSLAYKVFGAIKGLLAPVNKAIFPFLSKKYVKDKGAYYKLIKKISSVYVLVLSGLSLLTYLFSSQIIELISGKIMVPASELLEIFSYSMFFAIGAFFSLLLVIKSKNKDLSKITFQSMILNLILLYPSIYWFGIYGLAYHFLIVQIFHAYLQVKYNREIWV